MQPLLTKTAQVSRASRLLAEAVRRPVGAGRPPWIPPSATLIDTVLALLATADVRIRRRTFVERQSRAARPIVHEPLIPALIVGAARSVAVAKELEACSDLAIRPVRLVDEDSLKKAHAVPGRSDAVAARHELSRIRDAATIDKVSSGNFEVSRTIWRPRRCLPPGAIGSRRRGEPPRDDVVDARHAMPAADSMQMGRWRGDQLRAQYIFKLRRYVN
jgi:hypothetical protein